LVYAGLRSQNLYGGGWVGDISSKKRNNIRRKIDEKTQQTPTQRK